jgi:transcriptional regulator with XRE-family HTH domain
MLPMPGSVTARSAVGQRVREHRERQGMSMHALSRLSGVSTAHLSRIESGDRQPSISTLVALAEALGTSTGSLLAARGAADSFDQDGVTVTPVGNPDPQTSLAGFRIDVPGGEPTWPVQQHPGEELVHVLRNDLRLELDDEVVLVAEGDTFQYRADRRHRFTAASSAGVTVLLVTAPAGRKKRAGPKH